MTTTDIRSGQPVLRPVPGDGVLARQGDLVLLCDADSRWAPQVTRLLDTLGEVAGAGDGRELCRRLTHLLSGDGDADGYPALCAFGPCPDGWAVLLHGRARATLSGPVGQIHLDGRESVTCVNQLVDPAVTITSVRLGDCPEVADADAWSVLQAGVIRAGGVRADEVAPAPPPVGPLLNVPPPAGERGAPDPGVGGPSAPPPPADGAGPDSADGVVVLGVRCRDGHLNDPRAPYCGTCGLSNANGTLDPEPGRRPPLGVLTFDDGSTHPLDRGYLLGRSPDTCDEVDGAGCEPLLVTDRDASVSRVHARVDIDGWDVRLTDTGSTNGTFVWAEERNQWDRLRPGVPVVVAPGTWLRIGLRTLRYHSHRGI